MKQSNNAALLRSALNTSGDERAHKVADALREILTGCGVADKDISDAFTTLGYRDEPMQLIDLFQGALLREKMAPAMGEADASGRLKRGVMTKIHAIYAEIWADYKGDPSYGPEEFKAAYNKWKRATGGGGLSRRERIGRERIERKSLNHPPDQNG